MSYSVLLKLARYEKRQHYDVPEQSIIIADILESVQYLALHNIEICLSAESYINNKVQNIHVNHIIDEVIVPYHNHDFYEINYVMSGTLFEYVGNETYVLTAGQMLIMNPAVYHSYYALKDTQAFNILIRHEYIEFLRNTLSEEGIQTFLTRLVALSSFAVLESTTAHCFDSYINRFESIEKRLSLHPKLLISYTESLFTQFMIDIIDGGASGKHSFQIHRHLCFTDANRHFTVCKGQLYNAYTAGACGKIRLFGIANRADHQKIHRLYLLHLCHDAAHQHRHLLIKKHQVYRRADCRDGGHQKSGIFLQAL